MHRTRPALNPCPCVALTEKPESPVPAALCRLPAAEPDTKANVEAVEAGRRHSVALRWPGMTPSRFKSAYIPRRSNRRRTWHRFCGSQIGPLGCSGGIAHGVGRVLQALHCLPGCLSNRQSSSIFRHRAPPVPGRPPSGRRPAPHMEQAKPHESAGTANVVYSKMTVPS